VSLTDDAGCDTLCNFKIALHSSYDLLILIFDLLTSKHDTAEWD